MTEFLTQKESFSRFQQVMIEGDPIAEMSTPQFFEGVPDQIVNEHSERIFQIEKTLEREFQNFVSDLGEEEKIEVVHFEKALNEYRDSISSRHIRDILQLALRETLVKLVKFGIMRPERAESIREKSNFPAMEVLPEISDFEPHNELYWSLAMCVACDLRPNSPPAIWRIRRFVFDLMRPVFATPFSPWHLGRIRWA